MHGLALRSVTATRYVEALREGGSLPGLVEADDDGLYVVKLRGAGQGLAALVAEVVTGELARALGLPVPDLVSVDIDPGLARAEPDQEIQDLVVASAGTNLGMDFLPGSLGCTPDFLSRVDPGLAADVVWLDALTTNVDRTPRNPNLLSWHGGLWLIDHGASLFRQHGSAGLAATARDPFPHGRLHVLLPVAGPIRGADERLAGRAAAAAPAAVDRVPEEWLGPDPAARRRDLREYFSLRLQEPRLFVTEIENARP